MGHRSHIKNDSCFIGKRILEKAIRQQPEIDVRVRWRPFLLDPTLSDEQVDRQERLVRKFGSLDRIKLMQKSLSLKGMSQ
jgi:predicted DsbA family dithiol-disulfide isomerase